MSSCAKACPVKHCSIFEGENRFHHRLQIAADARCGQVRVKFLADVGRLHFQTHFPPTIVATARPFICQPWKGEFRDLLAVCVRS